MRKVLKLKRNNKPRIIKFVFIGIFVLIIILLAFFSTWKIHKINVNGGNHYSDENLIKKVIKTKLDHNALILYLKSKYLKQEKIPFIESVDVEIVNKNTVNLNVYEKTIVGCVEYMGEYMYFDKDGIVVESSKKKLDYVPFIVGLNYNKIVLHEKLEISNEKLYDTILELAQLIHKFKINIDKISFSLEQEVTLYSGNVKILLGKQKAYDEQLSELKNILPLSKKLKGTFNLKNYKPGQDIIFNKEK